MSIFGGGGGGSTVKAPKLKTVNIPQVAALARQLDEQSYRASDADYLKRFPQLVAGRQYNIGNAASNLRGETDPAVTNALQKAGLGTPNMGNTVFQQARSMGQPILAKEQRDRNYFQTLLQDNPQRAFGLSGGDVANLASANIGAQNAFAQQTYGTRIQGYNQNLMQNAANTAAIYNAIGDLGSSGIKAYGAYANQPTYGAGGGTSGPLSYGYYQSQQTNPYLYGGSMYG